MIRKGFKGVGGETPDEGNALTVNPSVRIACFSISGKV